VTDQSVGSYLVVQEAGDEFGEQYEALDYFTVSAGPEERRLYLPLVAKDCAPSTPYAVYMPLAMREYSTSAP
jgi:hypothetical protein